MVLNPLVYVTMLFTSMIIFSSLPLLSIWFLFELNAMAFSSIFSDFNLKNELTNKSELVKYFFVQVISSSFFLLSLLSHEGYFWTFLMILSIMIKIGVSPIHSWFTSIVQKCSSKMAILLMTWQKLLPIIALFQIFQWWTIFFLMFNLIMPTIEQFFTIYFMKIMGLSSVFNNSWMIICCMFSVGVLMIFILLYWSAVYLMMISFNFNKNFRESDMFSSSLNLFCSMNLAGLPPTGMFFIKWMILINLLSLGAWMTALAFLFFSLVGAYIYVRLSAGSIMNTWKESITMQLFSVLSIRSMISLFIYLMLLFTVILMS